MRDFYSASAREISVKMEFLFQFQGLVSSVCLSATLSVWSCNDRNDKVSVD